MYINAVAHYLPSQVVNNDYFLNVNGLSDEWIFQRTGIKQRRRAAANENSNSMGIEAVKAAISKIPYPISEVDLIVGATYTPHDTVGTLSHVIQREFNIKNAAAVTITSACSSLVNAVEIVEGYFALNKASKAIVVASENIPSTATILMKKAAICGEMEPLSFFFPKKNNENRTWKLRLLQQKVWDM